MEANAAGHWSLRRELARILLLTALLPALLFGIALLWSQWAHERDSLMLRLDAHSRVTANGIDDFLEGQLAGVKLMAEYAEAGVAAPRFDLPLLLRTYPAMLRALHVDAQGALVDGVDTRGRPLPMGSTIVANTGWFRVTREQQRPRISDVYRSPFAGNEVVAAVSAPLRGANGFEGMLAASVPVESFAKLNSDNLSRRNLELLLLDHANVVVYADPDLRWDTLDDTGSIGVRLRAGAQPATSQGQVQEIDGLLREEGGAYVEVVAMRNGWVLALVAPKQNLLAPFLTRLGLLLALLGATTSGVLFALWRQKRLLRDSIGYLLASLRGYAIGGRLAPAQPNRMPEELQPLAGGIGELAARMNDAFDDLRLALEEREHVIDERTESLRQAVSDLDRLSRTDALTGSLNYRGFLETAETLWLQARSSGTALSVLALDIDHFKKYNDLYGHAEGDGALRRFAGAVRSALLHADDVLARPGGEEFIVFLPGSTQEQAMGVGRRVCERVRSADIVHAASSEGRMTVSVGVASLQPGDQDAEQMLRRADAALYRAKAAGRNRASD